MPLRTQNKPTPTITFADKITRAVGSNTSLLIHTVIFAGSFILIALGADADRVLLMLTTIVSLEAIYLSLFIQISVNRNTADIAEIHDDIEEIAEDVEDIAEDVEGIERDIDEIQEDMESIEHDIDEIQEDVEGIEKDIDEIAEDVEDIAEDVDELSEEDESDPTIKKVGSSTSEPQEQLIIELLSEIKTLRVEISELKKNTAK